MFYSDELDYDFYEEESSSPIVDYDRSFHDTPGEDIFTLLDNDESSQHQTNSPPPQVNNDDNTIAVSTSINQTRHFVQQNFGLPISAFRSRPIPGLIILRIKDISSVRNEQRRSIKIPHLLYCPSTDQQSFHPELDYIEQLLNKQ